MESERGDLWEIVKLKRKSPSLMGNFSEKLNAMKRYVAEEHSSLSPLIAMHLSFPFKKIFKFWRELTVDLQQLSE